MRGHLLNTSTIGRAGGFGLIIVAIIATAAQFDRQKAERESAAARLAPSVDPLATALAHCQALGMAAQTDASCKAVWAENRRRFFTYESGNSETAAAPPQPLAPKIEDR